MKKSILLLFALWAVSIASSVLILVVNCSKFFLGGWVKDFILGFFLNDWNLIFVVTSIKSMHDQISSLADLVLHITNKMKVQALFCSCVFSHKGHKSLWQNLARLFLGHLIFRQVAPAICVVIYAVLGPLVVLIANLRDWKMVLQYVPLSMFTPPAQRYN